MDNVKNDEYYVKKIISDLSFVLLHTKGLSKEQFADNEVLIDSVLFRMIQVSENSDRLSAAFRERHGEIPWRAMRGLRNRIVHDYGKVDLTVIYETVVYDLPLLLRNLENVSED